MPYKLENAEKLKINEAYKAIVDCEDICRRGTAAGFDMTAQDLICQALRQRLDKLKEQFQVKVRE